MAIIISISLVGVFVNSYDYASDIPNPGHGADSISVNIDGSEMDLQSAVASLSGGDSYTGVMYDVNSCRDINVTLTDSASAFTNCESDEVVVALQTYDYNGNYGSQGEQFVSGIRCCDLILY